MTIQTMRFAVWIPKAKNTHLEYIIFINFTQQQWLHERAPNVRYTTYIACVGKRSHLTRTMDILFQRRVSVKLAAGWMIIVNSGSKTLD
jgi:hypothetical protein